MSVSSFYQTFIVSLGLFAVCGCDAKIGRFPSNQLYAVVAARREAADTPSDLNSVQVAIDDLFGTPGRPQLPADLASWLDVTLLARAAGPVSSDQTGVHVGLYREHCAGCHGIDGSGAGPTAALLAPYPRDFRHGVFKFKSTTRADKPTQHDLLTLLRRGIPGTAMPSFATENEDDLNALVQYTIYLSIRGETERKLIDLVISESLPMDALSATAKLIASEVAATWQTAAQHIVTAPSLPDELRVFQWWDNADLIATGRELFHGPLANCVSCHGKDGDGNATTLDFDDWTKEFTTKLGIAPTDRTALQPMRAAGALKPRQSLPRKLQWGVYHGDDDDAALYRRLVTGIAGTPMPGLLLKEKPEAVGVDPLDVWAIVAYLHSLEESK